MTRTVTFCIVNLKCKRCGKHRNQGFFYRHSFNLSSGTSTQRTCEICTNYRKYQDRYSYDEYESMRLQAYNDALLKQKGKYRCLQCDDVFDESVKIKKNQWCPVCRRTYRSNEAVKERLSRWEADSEAEYQDAKLQDKLKQRIISTISRISTTHEQWSRLAYQHWLNTASKKEISTVFYKLGIVWKNPNLSVAERYRVRYRFDEDFNIKERLRRQLNKAAKRDGIAYSMRTAINRDVESPIVQQLTGYCVQELKDHLESKFSGDMTWEAFKAGDIHIDHIKPQRLFNMREDEQWRECWALSNLQPLWAKDNLTKSGKYEEA